MTNSWKEKLLGKVTHNKKSTDFVSQYVAALPASYCEQHSVEEAVLDFMQIQELTKERPLLPDLQDSCSKEYPCRVKLYSLGHRIPLSDILPILENLGLRTDTERPYQIVLNKQRIFWISDFDLSCPLKDHFNLDVVKEIFKEALIQIISGNCINDGLNKLVLGAKLSWSEITILRAYMQYMHQTGFRYSQTYIENTLFTYAEVAKKLVQLFYLKFNLQQAVAKRKEKMDAMEISIETDIDAMSGLDADRIFHYFLSLIKATLRTNYFQVKSNGQPKDYLSIKIHSAKLSQLGPNKPLYEIFVYSPRFEGIHLRSSKVARGGIRWSERPEDFRVEIFGLMKAQKIKNAVIVPSGAKGGFVLKQLTPGMDRKAIQQEVVDCYQLFIRGLLDLTDNLVEDRCISPPNTICYDDADPYFVVAADKGTASFSDIANNISKEYHFWLGDAFASGGSAGYDHKKMGITARGVWESLKHHFRDLNLDYETQEFTMVGIGDMGGDVFGNGLLYTDHALLLAAFDHRHIFLDPNPLAKESFKERLRLFNLPTSSWADYNPKLISKGGGVFNRTVKSIAISPEVKKALDISVNSLPPDELIRAILSAPVDLLYNGGIGTYVKSSTESHADVGDKTNEFCRVNANDLRCKMVGEGGNLGFTQLSRVEYALAGGLINTDSIDNSGGVNCSDHEVNIKIMLNKKMHEGELTQTKRNQLLKKMTQEVSQLVLNDSYNQALVLSYSVPHAMLYCGLYQEYLKVLDEWVNLDRVAEFLPDDKKLLERKTAGQGLTRPELAIVMSYTKIYITNALLKSDLPDDPYFVSILETAFPTLLKKWDINAMQQHSLRREIIATQLSNQIVNRLGITFMYRMQLETGQSIADIARAYIIAAQSYRIEHLLQLIDSIRLKIKAQTQYELLHYIRQLMNLATRWFLRNKRYHGDIAANIAHYSKAITKVEPLVPELMAGVTKGYFDKAFAQFLEIGMPKKEASQMAMTRVLYTVLNVVEVATQNRFDLIRTAQLYFAIGRRFQLVWFRDQIASDGTEGHWNSLSRLSLRDELDKLQRRLTIVILKENKKRLDAEELITRWFADNPFIQERWQQLLEMLMSSSSIDYVKFYISLWELSTLLQEEYPC